MRNSRCVALAVLTVIAVTVMPLAGGTSTAAVRSSTTPTIGRQLAELKGSDTVARDDFGSSVAISGTTAVVGTSGTDYAGRAYVFTKTSSGWKQTAELMGSDVVAGDEFGASVSIWGTTVVVGAESHANNAGRAYVFTKTSSGWKQTAELKGSDTLENDLFGWSVTVFDRTIVVGATGHGNYAGRAYVFTNTAGVWKETAELKGSDTIDNDVFGCSVAISGTTAVVGAEGYANDAGAAYVFTETGNSWKQVAELKGFDTVVGDNFGSSVAVSGSTAVVGAFDHAKKAGRAYVFTNTAGVWKETAELKGSDTTAGDFFGYSVAISGTTAIVGAENIANKAGAAYVLTKTRAAWPQVAEVEGSDTAAGDWFGSSVAISGTTAVVGASGHAKYAGEAYVFEV
jgi:hypothetical protein